MVDFSRIIEKFPSIVPREGDSVIARYIDAFQEESDGFADDLSDIRDSRFIDQATGSELDQIGRMYGPLGSRAGRDDDEYRKYLKSLVPVFQYRGTVPGIKEAVAAGLDIESGVNGDNTAPAELEVYEHYNDDPANIEDYLEYTIILHNWTDHRGSTVEQLAELSDASVSRLRKTRYKIDPETMGAGDIVDIKTGEVAFDSMTALDTPNSTRGVGTDTFTSDDAVLVDDGKTTIDDSLSSSDDILVDPNKTTFAEDMGSSDATDSTRGEASDAASGNDATASSETYVYWDDNNWNEMTWATEHN